MKSIRKREDCNVHYGKILSMKIKESICTKGREFIIFEVDSVIKGIFLVKPGEKMVEKKWISKGIDISDVSTYVSTYGFTL